LAAVGRGQIRTLTERVDRRRAIKSAYQRAFAGTAGLSFMPEAGYGRSNAWLTCIQVDPETFGADREAIRLHLETLNIESRPVWKPMHLQPVFADCRTVGGSAAETLFDRGLCLPSGTGMSDADIDRTVGAVLATPRSSRSESTL